jgi:uncharacterized protein YehS (DUF1456 family)
MRVQVFCVIFKAMGVVFRVIFQDAFAIRRNDMDQIFKPKQIFNVHASSITGPGVKLELSLSKLFVGFSLSTLDLVAVLYIVDIKDSCTYRQPCFSSVKS